MAEKSHSARLADAIPLPDDGRRLEALTGFLASLAKESETERDQACRRSSRRHRYVCTVRVMPIDPATNLPDIDQACVVLARNISRGGVSFVCRHFLPWEEVAVELVKEDGKSVLLRSRVVRAQPFRRNLYEVGVEFLHPLGRPQPEVQPTGKPGEPRVARSAG